MRHFIIAFLFLLFCSTELTAQKSALPAFTQDFLDLPAPPPREDSARPIPRPFGSPMPVRNRNEAPADDAPIGELIGFWRQVSQTYQPLRYSPKPSARVTERLLEECKDNPGLIVQFLNIIPTDKDTAETVKGLFDQISDEGDNIYGKQRVKEWLTFNSTHFVTDLIKKVEKVADKDEYVVNQNELLALARVDWDRAAPYLERLVDDKDQPVSATLAKWAYYARALRENDENDVTKYRRLLQDVVENREILPGARDLALDALVKEPDWDGRDEWYVSLLSDESLYDLKVNGRSYTGLTTLLLYAPPEKYAKMMVSLMESKNKTIRLAAAKNLVALLDSANEDAVRALLPWLSDPKWLPEVPNARQRLVNAAGELKIPEAFTALTSIVLNEPELRIVAVRALVNYADPRAVQALKFGWANEPSGYQKSVYVSAIDDCGGFSAQEKMAALEAYLAMVSTPGGEGEYRERMYRDDLPGEKLSMETMLGQYISTRTDPGEELAALALGRLKVLRQKQPLVAGGLASVMARWNNRTMFVERLRQVKSGEADLPTVLKIISSRVQVLEKAPAEALALRSASGFPRGIAFCLSDNDAELTSVVRQTDEDATIGALGCARLLRTKLPVAEIGAMMASPNKLLAIAAERYLESEDSLAARTLILAKYPNEARILGARQAFVQRNQKVWPPIPFSGLFNPMALISSVALDKKEDVFREEIKSDAELLAVFALIPDAVAGQKVIRLFRDRVVYTDYEDEARYRERNLTQKEYDEFYRMIIDEKVDAMGPHLQYYGETGGAEFVMFGKNGGRRVFFSSVRDERTFFAKLLKRFTELDNGEMTLRYRVGAKIKGLEVLLADKNFEVLDVWKNGADMRVLIADKAREKELKANLEAEFEMENKIEIDPENYELQQQRTQSQRKRSEAIEEDHLSWRNFSAGKLGEQLAQPLEMPFLSNETVIPLSYEYDPSGPAWKVRAGAFEIRTAARWSDEAGIYKLSVGAAPVKFKEGEYSSPATTPDGEWVFVTKQLDGLGGTVVVRVNLRTGREFPTTVSSRRKLCNRQFHRGAWKNARRAQSCWTLGHP